MGEESRRGGGGAILPCSETRVKGKIKRREGRGNFGGGGVQGGGKGDRIIMHMNIMCVRAGVRICMGEESFKKISK